MTTPKPGEKVLVEVYANTRDDDGTFLCEGTWHAPVCTRSALTALCEAAGEAADRLGADEWRLAARLRSALAAVGGKSNG